MVSNAEASSPWTTLFADNRLKELGSELNFVSLAVVNGHRFVCFHSNEVVQEEIKWKNALVGCVYGLQPRLGRLSTFAMNRWKKYGLFNVCRINADLVLF